MRRALILLAVLGSSLACSAEPAQVTEVRETTFYAYDVAALKQGDWVEYENPGDASKPTIKWACVRVEANLVWIEFTSSREGSDVRLYAVSKASNLVLFAYSGKPGEVGRELKVTENHKQIVSSTGQTEEGAKISPEDERKLENRESSKCTVSPDKESIKVGDKEYPCERWTIEEVHTDKDGKEHKSTVGWWISENIPFARRLDKDGNPRIFERDVPWEGKRTLNGGVVKESRANGTAMVLKAMGTDAKPTLKTKADPDDKK